MRSMLFVIGIYLSACGEGGVGAGGTLVGKSCASSQECSQTCHAGDSHHPVGMCTVKCSSDADCPSGTACVDEAANIGAVVCVNNNDCAAFGRGYVCDNRDRAGAPGAALVCRVP